MIVAVLLDTPISILSNYPYPSMNKGCFNLLERVIASGVEATRRTPSFLLNLLNPLPLHFTNRSY